MHFSPHNEGPVYAPGLAGGAGSPGGRSPGRPRRSGGPRACRLPPGSAVSAGAPRAPRRRIRREGWSRRAPARSGALARPAGAPSITAEPGVWAKPGGGQEATPRGPRISSGSPRRRARSAEMRGLRLLTATCLFCVWSAALAAVPGVGARAARGGRGAGVPSRTSAWRLEPASLRLGPPGDS